VASQTRLGDYFSNRREPGLPGFPTFSVTLDDGLVRRDSLDRKQDSNLSPNEHLLVRKGDIVYNTMRMWQGACGVALHDGLVSPAYIVLSPRPGVDSKFASYWFKTHHMINRFREYSNGITNDRLRLYYDDFAAIPEKPCDAATQRLVVEIVSTWDAAIQQMERLIEGKKRLKSTLMQRLLTGKQRLPGFSRNWKMTSIGEFTNCTSGGTPSTLVPEYWGGEIKWMNSGELNLKVVEEVEGRITENGLRNSSTKMIPQKCVLVGLAGQGKTRGTVAINMVELCINQSIAAILPSHGFIPEYLFYNLDARYDELRRLSTGEGGRGGLNLNAIRSLPVPLPEIPEQTAIANILTNADIDIGRTKMGLILEKKQKTALLQKLLSGEVRIK
jgi:type I restriction enzyme S subunit